MQSFNLCYNFFAKNFLLSLSIFPLIFIFFLVFEVFFGNAHFIYAQISIIEIKPIEKKIVNVEQNLAKTENKNTSLVYEINPIVNDFSQRIISLDSQNNLLGTYEVNPISKNIQHIIYPDNSIPETYMQPFNQNGLNKNFILSYARGYVYSSFSIHELGEDVLSSEISNGKKQKQQQYTSYMIEPKISLAIPGINDFNISSTSNYTETIISSK
jgi:hypothetical protein